MLNCHDFFSLIALYCNCIALPEYVGGVSPQIATLRSLIGVVALRHRDLHELGNVESKGEHSDRQKVNEEAEGRTQCLQVKDILEKRCGSSEFVIFCSACN